MLIYLDAKALPQNDGSALGGAVALIDLLKQVTSSTPRDELIRLAQVCFGQLQMNLVDYDFSQRSIDEVLKSKSTLTLILKDNTKGLDYIDPDKEICAPLR